MVLSPDFRVNISVSDFPLFVPIERHFEKLKEAGVDGVELVPGYKSRSRIGRVKNFAKRQGLSVDSIHQPFWSVTGFRFDERLVWEASMFFKCDPAGIYTNSSYFRINKSDQRCQ